MMGNVVLFLIRLGIIDLGAFCVELWSKQVSYRISVPMSYISCLSHPPGAKIYEKQHLRIQGCHFLKSALNLDLTLSDDGKCLALLKFSGIIDLGAFCVELLSFYLSLIHISEPTRPY